MFSRGDTTYINQRGEVVAKQRSTSIRYLAEEARRRGAFAETAEPRWTEEQLLEVEREKLEYYRSSSTSGHERRLIVKEGEKLPRRPIGPHTIQSFTTEWRAFLMSAWGTFAQDGGAVLALPGRLAPGDVARPRGREDRPDARATASTTGPSRGHVQAEYAQLIGMPRGYGYGASMGAWMLDYLANWAGEWGDVAPQPHVVPLAGAHRRRDATSTAR